MQVLYYQNGAWHPYKSGVITGANSFTFTSKETGKKIGVVGYAVDFSALGVTVKLPNAKYFRTKAGARPSMFAFADAKTGITPNQKMKVQSEPQPEPPPEIIPPEPDNTMTWVLVAIGIGTVAYFALNKKKKR